MKVVQYPVELVSSLNKKLYRSIYLTKDGTILKNCLESRNVAEPIDLRLITFSNVGTVISFTYPYTLLADENGWIYGYEMEYLKDYQTLISFIKDEKSQLPFEVKKALLLQMHIDLRKVNRSYIVGDINLSNFMVDGSGNGKIIDFENGKPINCDVFPLTSYEIPGMNYIQEDAFKMFVNSISLLYKTDFESLFMGRTIDKIILTAERLKLDNIILEYLYTFAHEIYTKTGKPVYFDNFLNNIDYIPEKSCKKVRFYAKKEIYRY